MRRARAAVEGITAIGIVVLLVTVVTHTGLSPDATEAAIYGLLLMLVLLDAAPRLVKRIGTRRRQTA
jgi:hypothetical protein